MVMNGLEGFALFSNPTIMCIRMYIQAEFINSSYENKLLRIVEIILRTKMTTSR